MTIGRHSRRVFLRVGISWLALAAVPLAAQAKKNGDDNPGKGKGKNGKGGGPNGGSSSGNGSPEAIAASLTAATIHGMLGSNVGVVHVGAKPLPPGIQKNLARGKPLPPGIAKQAVPGPLLYKLPKVDGHDWIRVGTTLVLVGAATLVVKEIIDNVFD
ncbi:MAG TPA: anti-virulence regulator CigR family protein [Pelomicrobium sp.]|nr:anti-virulence regulator CigR family protein [Pelomicrobium sp.]